MNTNQLVKSRPVVILGMHRSGTSLVTRLVNLCGYVMGKDVIGAVKGDNPTGYWENKSIVDLNIKLMLESNIDHYGILEPVKIINPLLYKTELTNIIDREFSGKRFVIKDPRIPIFLQYYLDVFDEYKVKPLFLICIRNPLEVSTSLYNRESMNMEYALIAWLKTYRRIFSKINRRDYECIFFDEVQENPLLVKELLKKRYMYVDKNTKAEKEMKSFLNNKLYRNKIHDAPEDHFASLVFEIYYLLKKKSINPKFILKEIDKILSQNYINQYIQNYNYINHLRLNSIDQEKYYTNLLNEINIENQKLTRSNSRLTIQAKKSKTKEIF